MGEPPSQTPSRPWLDLDQRMASAGNFCTWYLESFFFFFPLINITAAISRETIIKYSLTTYVDLQQTSMTFSMCFLPCAMNRFHLVVGSQQGSRVGERIVPQLCCLPGLLSLTAQPEQDCHWDNAKHRLPLGAGWPPRRSTVWF